MRIYHGTSMEFIEQIAKKGILPRSDSGNKGNWKHLPSAKNVVYLSCIYAPYFAHQANFEYGALIEIEIPKSAYQNLLPDEDFLEQELTLINFDLNLEQRTEYFRENLHLQEYRLYWKESLLKLGTCAYQGYIPVEFISRITCWESMEIGIIVSQYNGILDISIEGSKKNFQRFELLTQIFAKREVDYSHLAQLIIDHESQLIKDYECYIPKNELERSLIEDFHKIQICFERS